MPDRLVLLLGYLKEKLAVVCQFGFDADGDDFMINVVATSVDHRRCGYASQAVDIALKSIEDAKQLYTMESDILARIHEHNEPSQQLFAGAGFEWVENDGEQYGTWIYATNEP